MALLALILAPGRVYACACGCGVFDVATSSMLPRRGRHGVPAIRLSEPKPQLERNPAGPAADNADKEIETDFLTAGLQYMFNRSWGVQAEDPYDFRYFKTLDDAGNPLRESGASLATFESRALHRVHGGPVRRCDPRS